MLAGLPSIDCGDHLMMLLGARLQKQPSPWSRLHSRSTHGPFKSRHFVLWSRPASKAFAED